MRLEVGDLVGARRLVLGDRLLKDHPKAGIEVRYLAATPDENGITAPGLVITQKVQFPGSPIMIFTYTLGRASARATVS